MKPKECVFCGIVDGSVPSNKIVETERNLSFLSLEGYPLLVPKKHIVDIFDQNLEPEALQEFGLLQAHLARLVRDVFRVSGVTILSANGAAAGQEIMHYHMHFIPRERGDRKVRIYTGDVLNHQNLDQIAERFTYRINQLGSALY